MDVGSVLQLTHSFGYVQKGTYRCAGSMYIHSFWDGAYLVGVG